MEFVPMKAEHALRLNNLIGVHAEVNITDEIARSVEASGEAVTASQSRKNQIPTR